MYQAGKGRRGLKGLGKIKVGSSKRHGEHVHGEEAAGGPPSDGDADLPSDSGGSDSDSGSGSDSDSDSSGALSDDLNVINAVEEPPEEDEAEAEEGEDGGDHLPMLSRPAALQEIVVLFLRNQLAPGTVRV